MPITYTKREVTFIDKDGNEMTVPIIGSGSIDEKVEEWFDDNQETMEQIAKGAVSDSVSDWLDDHIDSGYTVDNSLTVEGAAADAKVTGELSSRISLANDSLFKVHVEKTFELSNYGISPSTGANTAGSQYYRTGYMSISNPYLIAPIDGYKMLVWTYGNKSVSSAIYSPTNKKYVSDSVLVDNQNGAKYMRISFMRNDGQNMTTDESDQDSDYNKLSNLLYFYRFTDTSLELEHCPADSKTVGNAILNIENSIGKTLYNPSGSLQETTENGITYSSENGTAMLDGTATAKYFHKLQGGADSFPSWIEYGKEYYVTLYETGTKNIKLNITSYIDGSAYKTLFSSYESGSFSVPGDVELSGIQIRYYVPKGEYVSGTIHPIITSKPTLDMLMDMTQNNSHLPIKVRMMQNNIGKLNRGQPLDGTAQYLTTANKDDIILAYRNLYGTYQPDIIGIEEWVKTRDVRDATDKAQTVETINTDDLIFDRLYPQKRESTGLSSALSLKSKYPIKSGSKMERIEFSYEWEGETKSDHFYVLTAHIDIGGRDVMVGVTPFISSGGENVEKRKAAMPIVLGLFEEADYAFLICDANHAGNRGDTPGESWEPSAIEGDWLYENIIHPMGFNTVHGSYFPWQMTWESVNTGHRGCVDNIYYKDNGKVVFDGMKVLGDEFNSLLSDHVPVIADFTLL